MSERPKRIHITRDLAADLAEQRGLLQRAAASYDDGHEAEAKNVALRLRVLLHDTSGQRSLLRQMGVKDRIPWTDTSHGDPPPDRIVFTGGLSSIRVGGDGEVTYYPYLDQVDSLRIQPAQAFTDRWTESIFDDHLGNSFSRKDLVRVVANQDGGAHIDDRINAAYVALSRHNSIGFTVRTSEDGKSGFTIGKADGPAFANSVALANIRQIAWEVENSLMRHLVVGSREPYVRSPVCSLSLASAPRVAQDDPCPCGSGRSYQFCFERRQARTFKPAPFVA